MAVWRFGLKDEIRLQPEGTRVDRYAPHRGRQLAQPGRFAPQIRPLGSAICTLDKEFGRNYADLAYCHTQKEYAENDKAANRIIRKNHLDRYADVLDFLYMSDSEGEVGYKTCRNILCLIRDRKGGTGFRYGSLQHNDWEEFREFLQDCYSHHKKMRWR